MSSTDKRYLEMMEELKPHIKTSYLGNLKQWPSKIKSLDEIKSLTSKSGRFAAEKFNGKRYGLYFDFFRENITKPDGKLMSKEEIFKEFYKYLLYSEYTGSGDILDRIGAQRSKPGTAKFTGMARYKHDHNISNENIFVLGIATGKKNEGPDHKVLESIAHNFCERFRPDEKRFGIHEYSSSNGENGTKLYTLENEIMAIANMDWDDGLKAIAHLEQVKSAAQSQFFTKHTHFMQKFTTGKNVLESLNVK